jgi:CHAD domain.
MEINKLHEANMWCLIAVSERLNTMIVEMPAVVCGEDSDSIRRMRVASRRLAVAMKILGNKGALTEMRPLEKKCARSDASWDVLEIWTSKYYPCLLFKTSGGKSVLRPELAVFFYVSNRNERIFNRRF